MCTIYVLIDVTGSGFNFTQDCMRAETKLENIEINVLLGIHCPQDLSSLSSPVKPSDSYPQSVTKDKKKKKRRHLIINKSIQEQQRK